MVKQRILKSAKIGLYRRLERQVFSMINASLGLWFSLSLILIVLKDIVDPLYHVWTVLIGSAVGLFYAIYKVVYTATRSNEQKVAFVLDWYTHKADKAKHKLKFSLEIEDKSNHFGQIDLDNLLPSWLTEKRRQKIQRKIFVLLIPLTLVLISIAPWKKAFSEVFGHSAQKDTTNTIQWISADSCVLGSTYTLKAIVSDTGKTAGKLCLNQLIIKPLWKKDTLMYTVDAIDQELDFSWKIRDSILSVFTVKLSHKNQRKLAVTVTPPRYTKENIQDFINPKRMEVVEGSVLSVKDIEEETLSLRITSDSLPNYKNSVFLAKSHKYYVCEDLDTLLIIDIEVKKDQYPQIEVSWDFDSASRAYTAIGTFKDDYGISQLRRIVSFIKANQVVDEKPYTIIHDKGVEGEFADYFRRQDLWKSGVDAVEVYYLVCDNNSTRGSQCISSDKILLNIPNQYTWDKEKANELQQMEEVANDINSNQSKANQQLKEIRNNRLTESTSSADNQELTDFLENIEELNNQKLLLQEELESFQLMSKEFDNTVDTAKLNALLEQVKEDDKRSELLDKIREAIEKEDDRSMNDALDELSDLQKKEEMSLEMLERMLDQLLKENALNEAIESLKELSKKQIDIDLQADNAKDLQDDINNEFKEIEESIESGSELLGDDSPSIQESTQSLSEELEELQQDIESGNPSDSKKKGSSQKMQELSNMLSMAMMSAKQKQLEMDLATLQQLLENLIDLSLIEEDLFLVNDARNKGVYTKERKRRSQSLWIQSFNNVKDTLLVLASRSPSAQKPIMEGLVNIEKNISYLDESFERTNEAVWASKAQSVMMGVNEMSLILDEALQNLQMDLSGQMQGNQMCENPGGKGKGQSGKPSKEGGLKDIMSDQAAMGSTGEKEGKGSDGKSGGGENGEASDKALAKLIQEQGKIRNALEQWLKENNLEKEGKGTLDEMRKQEQRLAEGITETTKDYAEGLQNIELQLLKLNEAANKQGMKETRKSTEAQKQAPSMVPDEVQEKIGQILKRQVNPPKENPGLAVFYEKLWHSFTQ